MNNTCIRAVACAVHAYVQCLPTKLSSACPAGYKSVPRAPLPHPNTYPMDDSIELLIQVSVSCPPHYHASLSSVSQFLCHCGHCHGRVILCHLLLQCPFHSISHTRVSLSVLSCCSVVAQLCDCCVIVDLQGCHSVLLLVLGGDLAGESDLHAARGVGVPAARHTKDTVR